MPAKTIDEVIAQLSAIIRDCIARRDRLGYFAALYNRVTIAVKDGIKKGQFDDGPRMERLDVEFANRYIAAYEQYRRGELCSGSWLKAFVAAQNRDHIVLQHLLAGMNAHINLDLGIAAARTCPGKAIAGLQRDFNRINDVLAKLTPVVEQEIDKTSSVFEKLTSFAPRLELKMIGFSMDKARAAAWAFATELAPLSREQQVQRMAKRDAEATLVGEVVLTDGLIVRMIRSRENPDVAKNIETLCAGEFKSIVAPVVSTPAPAAPTPAPPR